MDLWRKRVTLAIVFLVLAVALGGFATSAFAAGPQPLPAQACNSGTLNAGGHAPNRTASEAIPHIEHAEFLPVVPYCHHFHPTASPPAGM